MNELAARKRLLIAEADLHRQVIRFERTGLAHRWQSARTFTGRNQWWILGGALGLGLLLTRRFRRVVQWLPVAVATWRSLSALRPPPRGPESLPGN